jgi:hypothetical protein
MLCKICLLLGLRLFFIYQLMAWKTLTIFFLYICEQILKEHLHNSYNNVFMLLTCNYPLSQNLIANLFDGPSGKQTLLNLKK